MDVEAVVTWSSVASCGVSFLVYLLYRQDVQDLEKARPIKRLDEGKELAQLLPLLIAIRGRAASDEPIQAEITGTPSVLVEVKEELDALKQNEKGEWLPNCKLIRHQKWETSWYLTDQGKTRLGVENCQQADFLETAMVETAQKYREAHRSLYSSYLDRQTGYRPLGLKKSERVLPVGSLITIVGELAQSTEDGQRKLVVRRPQGGGPFYISSKTLAELHASLSLVASTCKWLAVGFGALGAILISRRVYKSFSKARRNRQMRKRLEEEERRRRNRRPLAAARRARAAGGEARGEEEDEDNDEGDAHAGDTP
eukprot:evm.model.scf_2293.1 EVM.evm.TU.scf_2293.1   scf_2293:1739-10476(+)